MEARKHAEASIREKMQHARWIVLVPMSAKEPRRNTVRVPRFDQQVSACSRQTGRP